VHLLNLNNTHHPPPQQQHLPHNNISEILSLKTNVSLSRWKNYDDNDDYNDDVTMMLYAFVLPPLTTNMNFEVRYNNGEMYLYID